MISYKDRTFCCAKDCPVKNCCDRITRYDLRKAKQLGLEVAYFDFSTGCVEYHEEWEKKLNAGEVSL